MRNKTIFIPILLALTIVFSFHPIAFAASRKPAQSESSESSGGGNEGRLTYDLGVSAGKVYDSSYLEANLGFNYYFIDWLAWRNAFFYRFVDQADDLYGIDTSARAIGNLDLGIGGLTAFAGPGFRFVNKGKNAPFVEGGLVLKFAGLAIGGGVKTIFNDFADKDLENDTQFFIILSGAGSL
jgi:hypothetical protein